MGNCLLEAILCEWGADLSDYVDKMLLNMGKYGSTMMLRDTVPPDIVPMEVVVFLFGPNRLGDLGDKIIKGDEILCRERKLNPLKLVG
jgi:hypothetical protein